MFFTVQIVNFVKNYSSYKLKFVDFICLWLNLLPDDSFWMLLPIKKCSCNKN